MASPKKKSIVVHSRLKTPWRLGNSWFTYGPNFFTRDEYRQFEVHPLFLRRMQSGEFTVEDPEYPLPPPAPQEVPESVPAEGDEGSQEAAGDTSGKGKRKRKESEETPS
jgi:hypothetical protein